MGKMIYLEAIILNSCKPNNAASNYIKKNWKEKKKNQKLGKSIACFKNVINNLGLMCLCMWVYVCVDLI